MSTQPKPSEAQDLASDFFSGSGAVHVEARSAAGEVVSVAGAHSRRVTQALAGAKRWMVIVALGLTVVGSAEHIEPSRPGVTPTKGPNVFDTYKDEHLKDLSQTEINQLTKNSAGANTSFSITHKPKGVSMSDGPSASAILDRNGERTCNISLYKLDETAWVMSRDLDEQRAKRMREFVIMHEASHCEFYTRMDYKINATSVGLFGIGGESERVIKTDRSKRIGNGSITAGDQQDFLDQMGELFKRKVGTDAFSVGPTHTLMHEHYADIRTVLLIAKNTIGQAQTENEYEVQRKYFNQYANDIGVFRTLNSEPDPLHNTGDLILKVQQYINITSRTRDGREFLLANVYGDDDISSNSLKWSVAALIEKSHRINKEGLERFVEWADEEAKKKTMFTNQHVKDVINAIPRAKEIISSNKFIGYGVDDFDGGAKKLAKQATESYMELDRAYESHMELDRQFPSKTRKIEPSAPTDSLQNKLQSPNAMAGRIFGSSMLGGHDRSQEHHHQRRPGTKP